SWLVCVLETTFRTSSGVARVVDAMTLPGRNLSSQREVVREPPTEVVRAVEAVAGSVSMRWCLTPRFGFGSRPTRIGRWAGAPVATQGADAVALRSWGAGGPELTVGSIGGVRCHRRGAGSVRAERCSPGTARDSQPARRRAQTVGDGIGVMAGPLDGMSLIPVGGPGSLLCDGCTQERSRADVSGTAP